KAATLSSCWLIWNQTLTLAERNRTLRRYSGILIWRARCQSRSGRSAAVAGGESAGSAGCRGSSSRGGRSTRCTRLQSNSGSMSRCRRPTNRGVRASSTCAIPTATRSDRRPPGRLNLLPWSSARVPCVASDSAAAHAYGLGGTHALPHQTDTHPGELPVREGGLALPLRPRVEGREARRLLARVPGAHELPDRGDGRHRTSPQLPAAGGGASGLRDHAGQRQADAEARLTADVFARLARRKR